MSEYPETVSSISEDLFQLKMPLNKVSFCFLSSIYIQKECTLCCDCVGSTDFEGNVIRWFVFQDTFELICGVFVNRQVFVEEVDDWFKLLFTDSNGIACVPLVWDMPVKLWFCKYFYKRKTATEMKADELGKNDFYLRLTINSECFR